MSRIHIACLSMLVFFVGCLPNGRSLQVDATVRIGSRIEQPATVEPIIIGIVGYTDKGLPIFGAIDLSKQHDGIVGPMLPTGE